VSVLNGTDWRTHTGAFWLTTFTSRWPFRISDALLARTGMLCSRIPWLVLRVRARLSDPLCHDARRPNDARVPPVHGIPQLSDAQPVAWTSLSQHSIRRSKPSDRAISYNSCPELPWPAPATQVLQRRPVLHRVGRAPLHSKPRNLGRGHKHRAMRMPAPRTLRSMLPGDPTPSNFP
jgi:hypothetical protein